MMNKDRLRFSLELKEIHDRAEAEADRFEAEREEITRKHLIILQELALEEANKRLEIMQCEEV